MENNFLLTDEMLWDYADGFLAEAEKLQVVAYLQQYPTHQARLEAIIAEKRAWVAIPFEKPRTDFADRVMATWVAEQAPVRVIASKRQGDWIIYAITGAFALLLLLTFAFVISVTPYSQVSTDMVQQLPELPVVDWVLIFDSAILRYGLIFMLSLLSLQVLDKYLQHRRNGLTLGF